MEYPYYLCDVFTDKKFGGNQLAVITDARGLTDKQMQSIAREFNFSETTFVFPPESGGDKNVRIFTPTREVPFAGHPNIGTAHVLMACGELSRDKHMFVFEEKAGNVVISVDNIDKPSRFKIKAPEVLSLGQKLSAEIIARSLSLNVSDIQMANHEPMVTSVGLAFIVVELTSIEALERCKIHLESFEEILKTGVMPDIHVYVKSGDEFDIRTRMFAPLDGVPEDPATGSANLALGGLLAHLHEDPDAALSWKIAQGVEMKRPSTLHVEVEKKAGSVTHCWVSGHCVMFSEGRLTV